MFRQERLTFVSMTIKAKMVGHAWAVHNLWARWAKILPILAELVVIR